MGKWIKWDGLGTPSIPAGCTVEIETRGGLEGSAKADDVVWAHHGDKSDVVAYRVESVPACGSTTRPLDVQVGGGHYKGLAIQPVEFIHKNGIGFCEGNAIKYLVRWRDKGGVEDLKKAKHYIDLLIDMENQNA